MNNFIRISSSISAKVWLRLYWKYCHRSTRQVCKLGRRSVQASSISSSTVEMLQYFFCFLFSTIPSSLRLIIFTSLMRGNSPVARASYPRVLCSSHHYLLVFGFANLLQRRGTFCSFVTASVLTFQIEFWSWIYPFSNKFQKSNVYRPKLKDVQIKESLE